MMFSDTPDYVIIQNEAEGLLAYFINMIDSVWNSLFKS
jgi:hypothetical protein